MIRTKITMVDGTVLEDVNFTEANDIKEVRVWLNNGCNFIDIGGRTVINTQQIIRIVIES